MGRPFDKPITIQKTNELTEEWEDVYKVHARINKSKTDNEYLSAGATQVKRNLTFEVRYFAALEDISYDLQLYRILYKGRPFDLKDYDDYLLRHETVKLLGVSY